jgi:hypothetical protein
MRWIRQNLFNESVIVMDKLPLMIYFLNGQARCRTGCDLVCGAVERIRQPAKHSTRLCFIVPICGIVARVDLAQKGAIQRPPA